MVDADFNFKMPKIEMTEKSEDGKYGKFVVEPLVSRLKVYFMNSAQFQVLRKMLLRSS